jgi:hypothetical protein
MYYLRTKGAANALQFTIDREKLLAALQSDQDKAIKKEMVSAIM